MPNISFIAYKSIISIGNLAPVGRFSPAMPHFFVSKGLEEEGVTILMSGIFCNTQAIRVQKTLAIIGDGGNVRKRSAQWTSDDLSRPLKKHQRTLFHDK